MFEKVLDVDPGGTMNAVNGDDHVGRGGKIDDNGVVIKPVQCFVVSNKALPAGQGVFVLQAWNIFQGFLEIDCFGNKISIAFCQDQAGLRSDFVCQDRSSWPGIGCVVFETTIFKRVVAWCQVDGKGSLVFENRR